MNLLKDLFGGPQGAVNNAVLKDKETWLTEMFPHVTGSGVSVSEDNALTIPAVYACVRVLAETIAGLPVKVYERTATGKKEADHPLNKLLGGAPNDHQTSFELMEFIVASLGLRGNSYCRKFINGRGQVYRLDPLQAKYITPDTDSAGNIFFIYQSPDERIVFRPWDLWRTAGLSSNGLTGLSPVGLARESMGISMAAEGSAARLYSNGAQIPGVLEFPGKLSDEEAVDRLRNQWADKMAGAKNAFKPLILESGMAYKETGMNSKDAQFLESRKFQIAEIARWYRVPLHKLQELDRATFSNIEHQSIEFVTDTILPWVRRLEQTLFRDILTPKEQQKLFIRFNLDGLLRGDTQTRYEAYGKGINDGWLSRNEVRKLENRDPVDGLDEYLVPLNMAKDSENENKDEVDSENKERISNYLATREIRDTQKDRNPKDWAENYYTSHAERMFELGADKQEAANYAVKRINQLLDGETLDFDQVLTETRGLYA